MNLPRRLITIRFAPFAESLIATLCKRTKLPLRTKAMVGEVVAMVCSCLGRLDCCAACAAKALKWNKSELWWVCKNAGKHISALADALKSGKLQLMESMEVRLPAALVLIVAKYLFNFEIFAYITAAFPALGLASVHSEISKELGEPLINFLTPEQKKDCLSSIAFATVIVTALGLFGVPLLNSWLGD